MAVINNSGTKIVTVGPGGRVIIYPVSEQLTEAMLDKLRKEGEIGKWRLLGRAANRRRVLISDGKVVCDVSPEIAREVLS